MKGQLRISRVRRPRTTLIAVLMLGAAYCSLGLWVHGQQIVDNTPPRQVAEHQLVRHIDEEIEQMSQRLMNKVQKPSVNTIRVIQAL